MTRHPYLSADGFVANHHNDLIRSTAERNLAANRHPASDRRRIARPIVATLRSLVLLRQRSGTSSVAANPSSADVENPPIADLTQVR